MNGAQTEFTPFKLLLKQVYSAHTSRVKELENEVTVLREKLTEKVRELNVGMPECKRCNELEEAFKNCKKALHEQSKLFESFGQKFSIFNSSDHERQESKAAEKSSSFASEIPRISKLPKSEISFCDKTVSPTVHLEKNVESQNIIDDIKVLPISNSNLLKKVMCEEGSFENSLYTVTFDQNLKTAVNNRKLDSGVLVPDSLDVDENPKIQVTSPLKISNEQEKSNKKSPIICEHESPENIKENRQNVTSCKRLSNETLNEGRVKRCNKGDQTENNSEIPKIKSVKLSDTKILKDVSSNISQQTSKILVESKSDTTKLKNEGKISPQNSVPSNKNVAVDVSDKFVGTPQNSKLEKNLIHELKNRSTPYETSPSLIPMVANAQPKFIDLEPESNDNDDFQEQVYSNKVAESEDSWDTCDKRKLQKKNRVMKTIKCSSKFKMTLDAPPLNYKKPNYKQIKLSKSFFQPKNTKTKSDKKFPEKTSLLKKDVILEEEENSPLIIHEFQTSTPRDVLTPTNAFDIDATFIPDNFKSDVPVYVTTSVKKNAVEKLHLKNGSLFSNISFPIETKSNEKTDSSKKEDTDITYANDEAESKENMDSFDRLPVPEEPNYKYKNEVVRKKSERKQLNAFDCKECEKYYAELDLPDKEKKVRMKKCSRHRAKFAPPSTPDHFWELDFPDTEECKARGYVDKTQKIRLKNLLDL